MPGGTGIQTFQSLAQGSLMASAEFASPLIVSATVYVTIRCWNTAGLFTSKSSNGVAVVGISPSAEAAGVDILPSSATPYQALPDHHSTMDAVRLHWAGFKDPAGIKAHQVRISHLHLIKFHYKQRAAL